MPAPFAQASIVRPDPLARSSSMDLASLLQGYGYSVVVVGTVLEGETILALAGLAAHRGYLALPWVIAAAAAGGFLGDQIYFFVGRFYGPRVLARFPKLAPGVEGAGLGLRGRGAARRCMGGYHVWSGE